MNWKEILATILIGLTLSLWVSCCAPVEVSAPSPGGETSGQLTGDSGQWIVPGGGEDMVTAARQDPPHSSADVGQETAASSSGNLAMTETGDPLRGYWYGVGAVLIGQVVITLFGRDDRES